MLKKKYFPILMLLITIISMLFLFSCKREEREQFETAAKNAYEIYVQSFARDEAPLDYEAWLNKIIETNLDTNDYNNDSFYAKVLAYDDINGNRIIVSESIIRGGRIAAPQTTKEGFNFCEWRIKGSDQVFDWSLPIWDDISIYASWKNVFRIEYFYEDERIDCCNYEEGELIEPPIAPIKEGLRFSHWEQEGEKYEFGLMPAKDLILVAIYETLYTIHFILGVDDIKVEEIVDVAGADIVAPDVERDGYFFRRWVLNGEEFCFDKMPNENITLYAEWLESTNLPIMSIDLFSDDGEYPLTSVNRENYVNSKISLSFEDNLILDCIKASFKGRGNGSWIGGDGKNGYKIKFDKKQSLFGREANKHWVLLACINFDDRTLARNYLAYNMANAAFDKIEYTTNAVWVDLYVNGEYRGVYVLCEHVRVDKGRVDIKSEYGNNDTGFLVEYDAYASGTDGIDYFSVEAATAKHKFTVHSPDPEDYSKKITEEEYREQISYIKDYVERVYKAVELKDYETFRELADEDSFVDMYILHELFKNTDTGYSSFYLYKKPGGKLFAGPAWDFDGTMDGAYVDGSPEGIYVGHDIGEWVSLTCSELYLTLYQTEGFINAVKERWQELVLSIVAYVENTLNDEMYAKNEYAMGRNFVRWDGVSQEIAQINWVNNIKAAKQWLLDRIKWLNEEWEII